MKLEKLPEVGREYAIYDDGKHNPTRLYTGTVVRIVPFSEVDSVVVGGVPVMSPDFTKVFDENGNQQFTEIPLREAVEDEVSRCDWLYCAEPDHLIEVSAPYFDENNLWFIRSKNGGWFSIDIQDDWQTAELDLDGSITCEVDPELYDRLYH